MRTRLVVPSGQADHWPPLLARCPTRNKKNLGARQMKITSGKEVVAVIDFDEKEDLGGVLWRRRGSWT